MGDAMVHVAMMDPGLAGTSIFPENVSVETIAIHASSYCNGCRARNNFRFDILAAFLR
jgi:hypothetical protein